jgi:hypothetical protein
MAQALRYRALPIAGGTMLPRSLFAALFSIAIVSGAHADDAGAKKQEFVNRLFAGAAGKADKSYACFVRVYTAGHLARHPKQKVSRMKLLVTSEKSPGEGASGYSFRLGFNYRNRKGAFDSSGECRHAAIEDNPAAKAPPLGCSVDCDGGGIGIDVSKDNRAAIVSLERVRVWRNNKPDEEASYSLDAGQDDHVFRLERVDNRQCSSLVTDRAELAAMRKK